MSQVRCSIQMAAKKSGLSTHLIRMWQKRYGAVSPHRTDTNRRLYSESEIERLKLLRAAVETGHRIGNVANLDDDALRALLPEQMVIAPSTLIARDSEPADVIGAAVEAIRDLDTARLTEVLDEAAVAFGFRGALEKLVAPLSQRLGDLWRDSSITAAHEHFASSAIRTYLLRGSRMFGSDGAMPGLVVVTPAGQLHELGAVLAAAAAADIGWRVAYLGASLPAAEIAGAVRLHKARAVAISIVFPEDDPQLAEELRTLRRCLPDTVAVIAGGRAASAYSEVLDAIGARRVHDLGGLCTALDAIRVTSPR